MKDSPRRPTKQTNRKIVGRDEQTGATISIETDPETGVDIVRREIDLREANAAQVSAFLQSMSPAGRQRRLHNSFHKQWEHWESDLRSLADNVPELPELRSLMDKWRRAHDGNQDTLGILNQMVAVWNLAVVRLEKRERRGAATLAGKKGGETNRQSASGLRMTIRGHAAKMPGKGRGWGETKELATIFDVSERTVNRALKENSDR